MHRYEYAVLALAALILAAVFVVSPEGSATQNPQEVPANDIYFLSSQRSAAAALPDEDFAPH